MESYRPRTWSSGWLPPMPHTARSCSQELRVWLRAPARQHALAVRGDTPRCTENGDAPGLARRAEGEYRPVFDREATLPAGMQRRSNAAGLLPRAARPRVSVRGVRRPELEIRKKPKGFAGRLQRRCLPGSGRASEARGLSGPGRTYGRIRSPMHPAKGGVRLRFSRVECCPSASSSRFAGRASRRPRCMTVCMTGTTTLRPGASGAPWVACYSVKT